MKKRIIILATVLLLTGCSGNTPSESAPVQSAQVTEQSAAVTEEITVGYVTCEAFGVSGEPVIADNNSTFYRYAGKRWWVNHSEPAAEFVLRDGKYSPFFDYENDPAAGAGTEDFSIYPTVESFNDGGWKYIGTIKSDERDSPRHFYISPDGGTILQFLEDDGYAEVSEDEKLFTVGILVASAV